MPAYAQLTPELPNGEGTAARSTGNRRPAGAFAGRPPEFITVPGGWHAPLSSREGAPTQPNFWEAKPLSRPPSWPLTLSLAQLTELSPGPFCHPLWRPMRAMGQGAPSRHPPCSQNAGVCPEFTEAETCGDWPTSSSEKPGVTWTGAARG